MRLGEQIVRELGLERSNDTLSRWLAHHVAALMDAARDAQEIGTPEQANHAAQQCRTAIVQLWQHRSAWPHGWPPPHAVAMTKLLDDLPEAGSLTWHRATVLSSLQDAHTQVLSALLDYATFDPDTTIEQRWLGQFNEMLTLDERAFLTRITGMHRRLSLLTRLIDDDEDGSIDTRHPVLVLADAYRDSVYATVERALRADKEDGEAPERPPPTDT